MQYIRSAVSDIQLRFRISRIVSAAGNSVSERSVSEHVALCIRTAGEHPDLVVASLADALSMSHPLTSLKMLQLLEVLVSSCGYSFHAAMALNYLLHDRLVQFAATRASSSQQREVQRYARVTVLEYSRMFFDDAALKRLSLLAGVVERRTGKSLLRSLQVERLKVGFIEPRPQDIIPISPINRAEKGSSHTPKQLSWNCRVCTFTNSISVKKCGACASPRPPKRAEAAKAKAAAATAAEVAARHANVTEKEKVVPAAAEKVPLRGSVVTAKVDATAKPTSTESGVIRGCIINGRPSVTAVATSPVVVVGRLSSPAVSPGAIRHPVSIPATAAERGAMLSHVTETNSRVPSADGLAPLEETEDQRQEDVSPDDASTACKESIPKRETRDAILCSSPHVGAKLDDCDSEEGVIDDEVAALSALATTGAASLLPHHRELVAIGEREKEEQRGNYGEESEVLNDEDNEEEEEDAEDATAFVAVRRVSPHPRHNSYYHNPFVEETPPTPPLPHGSTSPSCDVSPDDSGSGGGDYVGEGENGAGDVELPGQVAEAKLRIAVVNREPSAEAVSVGTPVLAGATLAE